MRPGFDGISIAIPLGKLHYATVHMLMPFSTASRSDALSYVAIASKIYPSHILTVSPRSSPAVAMPERSV